MKPNTITKAPYLLFNFGENKMNLSYTDRITILSALSQKAEEINSWLKEYPNDEFWNDKLANVKAAYKNFSDREMEIGE